MIALLLLAGCGPKTWWIEEVDPSCPMHEGDRFELDTRAGGAGIVFGDLMTLSCARDGAAFDCEQTVVTELTEVFPAEAVLESEVRLAFTREDGVIDGEIRIDTACTGEDCDALEWPPCGVGDDPSPFRAVR